MASNKKIWSWLAVIFTLAMLTGCGISTTVQVGQLVTIGPNGHGTAVALCPDGMIATGGGFSLSNKAVHIDSSSPKESVTGATPVGWFISADNTATFDVGITAIAVCAKS